MRKKLFLVLTALIVTAAKALHYLSTKPAYGVATACERKLSEDEHLGGITRRELSKQDQELVTRAIDEGYVNGEPGVLRERRKRPGGDLPSASMVVEHRGEQYLIVSQISRTNLLAVLDPTSDYDLVPSDRLSLNGLVRESIK